MAAPAAGAAVGGAGAGAGSGAAGGLSGGGRRALRWGARASRSRRRRGGLIERALGLLGLGFGLFLLLFLLPLLLIVAALSGGGDTTARIPPGSGIPAVYLPLYLEAQRAFRVNWLLLASIHREETDFGRSQLPGVQSGVNSYGCCSGPMQFNVFDTWAGHRWSYRQGERPSGGYPLHKRTLPACAGARTERAPCVFDSFDALMAAAHKLRSQGAGMNLSSPGIRSALCGYNCSAPYMDAVQQRALQWQRMGATAIDTPGGPVSGAGLSWPVRGPVVSPYGMRWGRLHAGIDIAAPTGTTITAAGPGQVVFVGWLSGYGRFTCIRHAARLSTCYAHQSQFLIRNGTRVGRGQAIGRVGCTGHCYGPHLHFEVHRGPGWSGHTSTDPLPYLPR